VTYTLVDYKNENLNSVLENFDFTNPPIDPEQLAVDLVEFMRSQNAIGLAANQLGLPYRAFAMEGEPAYVCFNPKIVMPSNEQVFLDEACLTFEKLYVKVKRPRDIKVRFQGPDSEVYTKTFSGMTARIFQHELDHLDGVSMLDRANRIHKEQALNKWKKLKRKNA
jgi:peptide deformylase